MKTRLCSLLLILSMVAATFTLLVTPAMAEEGVVNTTPAVAPAVKNDFSDIPADAWWNGDTEPFSDGDGTEKYPFKIANANQLAFLSNMTSAGSFPYYIYEGENQVTFPSNVYEAHRFEHQGDTYYVVKVDTQYYLYCTTSANDENGQKTAIPVTVKTRNLYRFSANGVDYYTTVVPGKGKTVQLSVLDENFHLQTVEETLYLTADGKTFYIGSDETGVKTNRNNLNGTMYLVIAGHKFDYAYLINKVAGQAARIEYNGAIHYYFTNTSYELNTQFYKTQKQPVKDANGSFVVENGAFSSENITYNSFLTAHYELTADIYLNKPTESMLQKWNKAVSMQENVITGERDDFIISKTDVHFFKPIAENAHFNGSFDGKKHTIYGLAIEHTRSGSNVGALTGNAGLFASAKEATFKNMNFAYAAVCEYLTGGTSVRVNGIGILCGVVYGTSKIDNCHIVSSNLYTSLAGGGFVGMLNEAKSLTVTNSTFDGNLHLGHYSGVDTALRAVGGILGRTYKNDAHITIENCTVSGLIKTECTARAESPIQASGFVCAISSRATYIIKNSVNYADVISTTDASAAAFGGEVGQTGSGGPLGIIVENCINYGDVSSASGNAGGIATKSVAISGTSAGHVYYGVHAYNFINYGTISGVNAGQVIGIYGNGTVGQMNTAVELRNCVLAGEAIGATAAASGAIIGTVQNGSYTGNKFASAQMIIDHVYYKGNERMFGTQSAELTAHLTDESKADYIKEYGVITDMQATLDVLNAHVEECGNCETNFATCYTRNSAAFMMDASKIQGASLQLGSGIGINLYAKPDNHITLEGFNRISVANNGLYRANLKDMGKVTIDGTEYFHYQLPVNPAEIGNAFTFTLNNGYSIEYGVEAYAVRKYANGSAKLQGLLEALMAYGDAARVNKGIKAKSMAAIGKTYDANAIDTAYESVNISPAEGGNEKFISASLNLNGHINLLLKVADGVKKVSVTYQYTDTEGNVQTSIAKVVDVANGEAVYEGIVATALNLHYHLVALGDVDDDDGVDDVLGEMDWNVSRFIQNGLNGNFFNDSQATLAKALALYMQSARMYTGLDEAAE